MIRTQRFCYHILAPKKATIESHIENRADLGEILLMFLFCFIVKRIFVCTCFADVSWGVYGGVCFCQWERFLLFVQRNWHLISTIYINYCFKVCCQETFPWPDSCVLKGKLLLLLFSVSLHRGLGFVLFFKLFYHHSGFPLFVCQAFHIRAH